MVSITAKLFAAFALLVSVGANNHGHVPERDSTALVLSSAQEETDDSCEGCQHRLVKQEDPQDSPPEFVPTHEWQDILPNQAIPPGLYIRVNLETGKKEAKLLD